MCELESSSKGPTYVRRSINMYKPNDYAPRANYSNHSHNNGYSSKGSVIY